MGRGPRVRRRGQWGESGGICSPVKFPFLPQEPHFCSASFHAENLILFQSKQTNGFYFSPSGHRKALVWDKLVRISNSLSCLQVLEISLELIRCVSEWL